MTKFDSLPFELVERICSILRPPGVPMHLWELRKLAGLRTLNRTWATALDGAVLLAALHITVHVGNPAEMHALPGILAASGQGSHVKDLVFHDHDPDDRFYEDLFYNQKNARDLPALQSLCYFSIVGICSLNYVGPWKCMRRLAIDSASLANLASLASCPGLSELVVFPGHGPDPRCYAGSLRCQISDKRWATRGWRRPLRLQSVHYEAGNTRCMLGVLEHCAIDAQRMSVAFRPNDHTLWQRHFHKLVKNLSNSDDLEVLSVSGLDHLEDPAAMRALLRWKAEKGGFELQEKQEDTLPDWVILPLA